MAPIQYVRGLIVRVQKDSPTSITLIFAWCEKLGDVQVQPGALQGKTPKDQLGKWFKFGVRSDRFPNNSSSERKFYSAQTAEAIEDLVPTFVHGPPERRCIFVSIPVVIGTLPETKAHEGAVVVYAKDFGNIKLRQREVDLAIDVHQLRLEPGKVLQAKLIFIGKRKEIGAYSWGVYHFLSNICNKSPIELGVRVLTARFDKWQRPLGWAKIPVGPETIDVCFNEKVLATERMTITLVAGDVIKVWIGGDESRDMHGYKRAFRVEMSSVSGGAAADGNAVENTGQDLVRNSAIRPGMERFLNSASKWRTTMPSLSVQTEEVACSQVDNCKQEATNPTSEPNKRERKKVKANQNKSTQSCVQRPSDDCKALFDNHRNQCHVVYEKIMANRDILEAFVKHNPGLLTDLQNLGSATYDVVSEKTNQ